MKQTLLNRWRQLSSREQLALRALAAVLLLGLIWTIAIAPARQRLAQSLQERQHLSSTLTYMQSLSAQAQSLQTSSALPVPQAWAALQSVSTPIKGLQARQQGSRVLVDFTNVTPADLSQWFAQARAQAQSIPLEVHLTQTAQGWNGQAILLLPGQERRP